MVCRTIAAAELSLRWRPSAHSAARKSFGDITRDAPISVRPIPCCLLLHLFLVARHVPRGRIAVVIADKPETVGAGGVREISLS